MAQPLPSLKETPADVVNWIFQTQRDSINDLRKQLAEKTERIAALEKDNERVRDISAQLMAKLSERKPAPAAPPPPTAPINKGPGSGFGFYNLDPPAAPKFTAAATPASQLFGMGLGPAFAPPDGSSIQI